MEVNHIYQYSLLDALMSGVCEHGITASELKSKDCNHGLGTFSRLHGELVLLDNEIYRLESHGKARNVEPEDQIPFVMAINFVPQKTKSRLLLNSKADIDTILDQLCGGTKNLFLAYRLEGRFAYMKTRSVLGQAFKGQPLGEVGKTQSVDEYSDIRGTVIGFRSPENWQGFSVAGEHLHFLSADRTQGGHLLDVNTGGKTSAKLEVAVVSNVHVELPLDADFNSVQLITDSKEVEDVEG